MMKTGIVYLSRTGNTKKVADAIASVVPGELVMGTFADAGAVDDCELVFLGMPVEKFGAPKAVEPWVREHLAGKQVALFVTHAAPEGETENEPALAKCREAASVAEVVAFFDCQGELDPKVARVMMLIPGLRKFAKRQPETQGQPDESRLAAAREFARATIEEHAPVLAWA